MQNDILKIIEDGVNAPSGENCQPWRFEIDTNNVYIFNVEEADQSLYNSKQKGSYLAHGALIETMIISASYYGYITEVSLFPDTNNTTLVAILSFVASVKQEEILYPYIKERCTNRKDYTGKKLSTEEKNELCSSLNGRGVGAFTIIDDTEILPVLGSALAVNEKVLFENKYLHDFFYKHIFWNKKDEDKAGGFYIETLEFLPHQLKGVKLFKHWTILRLLNRFLKVSTMISKENGEKYTQGGTFGAVLIDGASNIDYVNAGRASQRVWLTATKLRIAMHPCNGVIYFMEQIRDNGGSEFSKEHHVLIEKAYADIRSSFSISTEKTVIPMIFRIGFAEKPSARSVRLKPVITVTKK